MLRKIYHWILFFCNTKRCRYFPSHNIDDKPKFENFIATLHKPQYHYPGTRDIYFNFKKLYIYVYVFYWVNKPFFVFIFFYMIILFYRYRFYRYRALIVESLFYTDNISKWMYVSLSMPPNRHEELVKIKFYINCNDLPLGEYVWWFNSFNLSI